MVILYDSFMLLHTVVDSSHVVFTMSIYFIYFYIANKHLVSVLTISLIQKHKRE
jgi:hypothetical protein